jgi:hypothetical protein
VFVQALGGGERMAAARREVFERFERRVQQYLQRVPADATTLDIPVSVIAGTLRHIVPWHLRTHAEDQLPGLLDDGLAWLYAYVTPPGAEPWSTSPKALLDGVAPAPPPQPWSPKTLPPGTHGLSASVIARSQRTRLPHATAQVMMEKGYAATNVDDIAAAARVAKPAFYQYFEDKQHAFGSTGLPRSAHPRALRGGVLRRR